MSQLWHSGTRHFDECESETGHFLVNMMHLNFRELTYSFANKDIECDIATGYWLFVPSFPLGWEIPWPHLWSKFVKKGGEVRAFYAKQNIDYSDT